MGDQVQPDLAGRHKGCCVNTTGYYHGDGAGSKKDLVAICDA